MTAHCQATVSPPLPAAANLVCTTASHSGVTTPALPPATRRHPPLRDQPRLVPTPQELGDPPVSALYRFREAHGLPHHPRAIVYSLRGALELTSPLFNTPGMDVLV